MHPAKKRNSSSETLCEAPAKKVSEPPVSNDDSKKSSIMKAFEAIIAAGRRGLLGPKALAAVGAMPAVDLPCCDELVGQETPSSGRTVERRREEREERRREERREERRREERREERRREERREERRREERRDERRREERRREERKDERSEERKDERRNEERKDERRSEERKDERRSEERKDESRKEERKDERRSEERKDERRKEERKDERRSEERKDERRSEERKDKRRSEEKEKEEKEERRKEEKERGEEEKIEERKEENMTVNKECNTVVAVTPLVKDAASLQPTKKEIWICGDSVITLSRMRAQFSQHGLWLGFPSSLASVYWRGTPTMMWDDLLPILHAIYHNRDFPSIIAIHLGESDLLIDRDSLLTRIQSDLDFIRRALPYVVIIWSSLLPKHVWTSSKESKVVEFVRNNINRKMEEYCNETGICYLAHPLITGENKSLFSSDDTLSNAGGDVFISDLRKVLNTYVDHNPS